MDWLDYRQALGLSFNDNQKKSLFIKRIEVFMQSGENCPFEEQDEIGLAYMIGKSYLLAEQDPRDFDFGNDPLGLQRAWLYLSKRTKSFADFLSCLVALINTYGGKKTDKRMILSGIKKALEDCRISFEIIEDDDGIFIFPKGAKELDDALVSEPLEWLADYPESRKAFVKALKEYSETTSDNASDIADKFRKTLENFFQEYFGGNKSLENYKNAYGTYLKSQGVPKEVSGNFETLLQAYTSFMNNYAKHRDATSNRLLEYLMYQTGNIIRLLITLKQGEDKQ